MAIIKSRKRSGGIKDVEARAAAEQAERKIPAAKAEKAPKKRALRFAVLFAALLVVISAAWWILSNGFSASIVTPVAKLARYAARLPASGTDAPAAEETAEISDTEKPYRQAEPTAGFSDAEKQYKQAELLAAEGKTYEAATAFYKIKDYKDSWERCFSLWGKITSRKTFFRYFGVNRDGTINNSIYGLSALNDWQNIEAIATTNYSSCGLTSEGKVLTARETASVGFSVSDWEDIVAVSVADNCIVGLKADGTVLARLAEGAGQDYGQCEVDEWTDIVMVSTGGKHTVGLKTDGTVVAAGENGARQCDVSEWTDIVFISASSHNTIGVRKDGTVVAAGSNKYNQCEVSGWEGIVKVSSDTHYTLGLKTDGTVVSTNISNTLYPWPDIVDINAQANPSSLPIGLRSNGDAVILVDSTVTNGNEEKLTIMTGLKTPDP